MFKQKTFLSNGYLQLKSIIFTILQKNMNINYQNNVLLAVCNRM